MLVGVPPFRDENRKYLFDKILTQEVNYPQFLSVNAKDLINGLLQHEVCVFTDLPA